MPHSAVLLALRAPFDLAWAAQLWLACHLACCFSGTLSACLFLLAVNLKWHTTAAPAHCQQDDLSNADRSAFMDAKNFRSFCPVESLPAVSRPPGSIAGGC